MLNRIAIALSLAAAAVLLPATAWSQATVVSLTSGTASLDQTAKAVRMRLGSFEAQPLNKGDALGVGDELRGEAGEVSVELRCTGGSQITLSGRFRVVISPPSGRDCTLDMLSGTAHFLSDPGTGGTGGRAGETAFAAESTWYEVSVTREGETLRQEVNVYEGTVVADTPARRERLDATANGKLVVAAGTWQVASVTAEDRTRTAKIYTSVDVSKVPPESSIDRAAAYDTLYEAYAGVLAEPQKPEAQVRLGAVQLEYSLVSEALARLQPDKVGGDSAMKAAATLLRSNAYRKLGDSVKAEELRREAIKLNPKLILLDALQMKKYLADFAKKRPIEPPY